MPTKITLTKLFLRRTGTLLLNNIKSFNQGESSAGSSEKNNLDKIIPPPPAHDPVITLSDCMHKKYGSPI